MRAVFVPSVKQMLEWHRELTLYGGRVDPVSATHLESWAFFRNIRATMPTCASDPPPTVELIVAFPGTIYALDLGRILFSGPRTSIENIMVGPLSHEEVPEFRGVGGHVLSEQEWTRCTKSASPISRLALAQLFLQWHAVSGRLIEGFNCQYDLARVTAEYRTYFSSGNCAALWFPLVGESIEEYANEEVTP